MAAGTGRALWGMLAHRENTVVLAPTGATPGSPAGARVLPIFRFSHRARGPFKIFSALQHLETVLAPTLWVLTRRRWRPDVIVCIQPLFSGVGGLLARRMFGIPLVVLVYGEELTTWRGDPAPFKLRWRLLRRVLSRADGIVSTSEKTRDMAEQLYGVAAGRIRVIYPAIETTGAPSPSDPDVVELRRRTVGGAAAMLLTVGRLSETHKGFDTAIQALALVLKTVPDVRLVIAGPGDAEPLQALAASLGVGDNVVILGHTDQGTLTRLFAACDAFVLPGREVAGSAEGFGVVFLEAALAGKPVVGGLLGGVPEAVSNGETGLLVDGRSPEAVAGAIVRLLCDPATAAKMGERGKARVLADFDGRRQHQQMSELLAAVAASRSGR
jgi:phosphatidylinositol alpha-1,6-mannosyltransferase